MDRDAVDVVRRFNRTVTQRVGALQSGYLARDRSLGASRVLWEIGTQGRDVRDLRATLDLDSGYLSRLLRSLERAGLARTQADPEDGRVRAVRLTPAGIAERAALDDESNTLAWSLIEPLNQAQRARLLEAMTTVERLLTAGLVDDPDRGSGQCRRAAVHRGLLRDPPRAVRRGLRPCREHPRRRGGPHPPRRPVPGGSAARPSPRMRGAEAARSARPPRSSGCGCRADARGLGLGRRLLAELEREACGARGAAARLETNRSLLEAISLYRSSGYVEVPAFNDEPYAHHWFEKPLQPPQP